jgi:hypothetical protein
MYWFYAILLAVMLATNLAGFKIIKDRVNELRAERDQSRIKPNALDAKNRELQRATDRLRSSEEHARKGQGKR